MFPNALSCEHGMHTIHQNLFTYEDETALVHEPFHNIYPSLQTIRSLCIVPPHMFDDDFTDDEYRTIKVVVPEESLEAYRKDPVWGKFWSLHDGKDPTSIVETTFDENEMEPVYNLQGVKVGMTRPHEIYIERGRKYLGK